MKTQNTVKRLGIWAAVVSSILTIPLIAHFPWTGSDYVAAGIMLFGSATAYELITRNMVNKNHRKVVGVVVALGLIFMWGLAVSGS